MAGGEIDSTFRDRISDLREQSQVLAQARLGDVQSRWMTPANWQGDPLDVPQLHLPGFDRSGVNSAYLDVHRDSGGSVGDAGAMKLQLDYLSIMERSFRSRHATSIRCLMHAGARHAGHAHSQGVFATVLNTVQDLIQAGGESQ